MIDLDTILPTLATKADIAKLRVDIAWWLIWTVTAVIGAGLAGIFAVAAVMRP